MGESREPSLMPRNCGALLVGCGCRVQGLAAGKRQALAGHGIRSIWRDESHCHPVTVVVKVAPPSVI